MLIFDIPRIIETSIWRVSDIERLIDVCWLCSPVLIRCRNQLGTPSHLGLWRGGVSKSDPLKPLSHSSPEMGEIQGREIHLLLRWKCSWKSHLSLRIIADTSSGLAPVRGLNCLRWRCCGVAVVPIPISLSSRVMNKKNVGKISTLISVQEGRFGRGVTTLVQKMYLK